MPSTGMLFEIQASVARLVERYLVLVPRLDKPKAVQRSDWENVLNERQQICAFSLSVFL